MYTLKWQTDGQREINRYSLLGAIIEFSNDIIISKNLDGIITSWNPAAEKIFGYTETEALGQHISLIIPKEHLDEERYIIGEISKGTKIDHFETIRISKTGKKIPISLSVSPIKDEYGQIIGASKIARDISEKRYTEERQDILAAIVNSSDDAIVSKTLKGIITSWNVSAEKMFGYTKEEAIGNHISIIIPLERLNEEAYIISQIAAGKKVDHFETIRKTKDGSLIPISLTVSPIRDVNGVIIGASKIARDISLQKAAEATKKRYMKNLEIINSLNKLILEEFEAEKIFETVIDTTTKYTGAGFGAFLYNHKSETGESYHRYTFSGVSGSNFENFEMPFYTAAVNTTFTGKEIVRSDDITKDARYESNKPHDGMPFEHLPVASYLSVPVIAKSGIVIGRLFYGHPNAGMFTSDHEDVIASIATLTAIGLENANLYNKIKTLNEKKDEFIGLASHELKTPLTSIIGYLQIVLRADMDDNKKRLLSKCLEQSKKLSNLVADMLDVSKIEAGKLQFSQKTFDIKDLVNSSVELTQHLYSDYKIKLETNITSLDISGDPERIEQVLMNLLTNAVKYSAKFPEIIVYLNHDEKEVQIGVKDSGMGISKGNLDLIFEKFYRVNNSNAISGLGIGLYISQEIVKRHGGKIWAESEPGKGSTFWVTIPCKQAPL